MSSSLVMTLNIGSQLLTNVLATTQQHQRILLEEQWVVDISVSCTHRPLVDNDSLGLPYLQHGHACNWAVWILQSR
jgi:hypothetical protein